MATTFKQFLAGDTTTTKTLLHESIPLTGALASGTYGTWPSEENIKNYAHGIFQSVYDYPYLSSSANHIFDITVGYASDSSLSSSTPNVQQAKKINIYNQMSQVLMGHDHTGSILPFDEDGNILAGGTKMKECFFLNFSRLLYKDEIKKGSFTIKLGTGSYTGPNNNLITITDSGAQNDYRTNSPAGEYGILSASSGEAAGSTTGRCGLLFYQAGIAVLTASIFTQQPTGKSYIPVSMSVDGATNQGESITGSLTGSEISASADYLRRRIYNISFNNTTELNSAIYFCRLSHNEFNYSSNPTYVSGSKIRIKNNTFDEPVTYVTTIGLYNNSNELMAVAKLSEPLKKTPSNEMTIRVRLDS